MKKVTLWLSVVALCAACGDDTTGSPDVDARVEEARDSSQPEPDSGPMRDSSVGMNDSSVGMNDSSVDMNDASVDESVPDGSAVDATIDGATDEPDAEADAASDAEVAPDAMADAEADASEPTPDAALDASDVPDASDASGPDPDPTTVDICGTVVEIADYTARGSEWIIDISTRAANAETNPIGALVLSSFVLGRGEERYPWIERPFGCEQGTTGACYDRHALDEQLFDDSDTARAVVLGINYSVGSDGTGSSGFAVVTSEDLFDMVEKINDARDAEVVLPAAPIMPNDRIALQLERMDRLASQVSAWLIETGWGPTNNSGFFLDDTVGAQAIESGIARNKPIFLVRKGMPLSGYDPVHTSPRDIGPAAVAYPMAKLVVLQSAFEHGLSAGDSSSPLIMDDVGWGPGVGQWPEGPYDDSDEDVQALYPLNRGVNSLITSLLDSEIEPGSNVYAALDSVWAELITRPTEAAHVLGKLLLYVGEDNILWGTDSVFYGGPDPQIEAFRDFEIPESLRNMYGYPELTPERKAKILGLNAARLFCLPPPVTP